MRDQKCDMRVDRLLSGCESGDHAAENGEDCGEEIEGCESAADDEDRVAAPLAEA